MATEASWARAAQGSMGRSDRRSDRERAYQQQDENCHVVRPRANPAGAKERCSTEDRGHEAEQGLSPLADELVREIHPERPPVLTEFGVGIAVGVPCPGERDRAGRPEAERVVPPRPVDRSETDDLPGAVPITVLESPAADDASKAVADEQLEGRPGLAGRS